MASLEKNARNKPLSERKLHSLKDIIAMEELKKDTSITKGVLTTARSSSNCLTVIYRNGAISKAI